MIWIAVFSAVLLIAFVALTVVGVRLSFLRPKTDEVRYDSLSERHKIRYKLRQRNNQYLYDKNPEDVSIEDRFGNTLRAWLVPGRETKKFVICVHGYKCNGPDEFSHMLPFYNEKLGFNYLLPDHAAHGRSTGKYIGFGAYEADNVLLWVQYLTERFGNDIELVLHGISMGAATVMLCNESNPPEQVKAVIEDCGYTCAYDIINNTTKRMVGFSFPPLTWCVNLFCRICQGFDMRRANCLKRMPEAKKPMLFIHGTNDPTVPFEMGQKLYDACTVSKDCMWVKGAVHAYSYYDAKTEYEEKVVSFLKKFLFVDMKDE
ncbi:MAG TPA: hypothetical protein DDY98_05765 [Ruminococcaceae bacterium]|nr:hypothetical protein [Oscillospiraceae bacterium]